MSADNNRRQLRKWYPSASELIEELFPKKKPAKNIGADALRLQLSEFLLAAQQDGMHPVDALAIIVEWAASEMVRIGSLDDRS